MKDKSDLNQASLVSVMVFIHVQSAARDFGFSCMGPGSVAEPGFCFGYATQIFFENKNNTVYL
jgi:hypothetical protein